MNRSPSNIGSSALGIVECLAAALKPILNLDVASVPNATVQNATTLEVFWPMLYCMSISFTAETNTEAL